MQIRYKISGFFVLTLILLSIVLHQIIFIFFNTTSFFSIKTIVINDAVRAKNNDFDNIVALALKNHNNSLIDIDIKELKDQLLSLDLIEDINIQKDFPSSLKINIIERIPIVEIKNSYKSYIVDKYGFILPLENIENIPTMTIEFEIEENNKKIYDLYLLKTINAFTSKNSDCIESMKVDKNREAYFKLKNLSSEFYIEKCVLTDSFIVHAKSILECIKNKHLPIPSKIDIHSNKENAIGFFNAKH